MTAGRRGRRVLLLAVPVLFCGSGVAYAHVTVQPGSATAGSEATLTFRVPCEKDDADTVKVMVAVPSHPPIPSVSVQPVPGWRATVTTRRLSRPVPTDDGPVTTAVARVTWTVGERGDAIRPGQFQTFTIATGPLPAGRLVFKTLQYYSDGSVTRWIDAPGNGDEPDHPAPVVQVGADQDTASTGRTGDAGWIAVAAFVAGLLGFAAGSVALVVARRSARSSRS